MNGLKKMILSALDRINDFFTRQYGTTIVQDMPPTTLKSKTLYIVEDDGYVESASMVCPCGCGKVLHMNLLQDERPCWRVEVHRDGSSSLHPSVWRKVGCKSHFWFKAGRVRWCQGSGPWWRKMF